MGIMTNPKIQTAYPTAGILTNLKNRKTAEWLTATTSESATVLDTLLKVRYGKRVLNTTGLLIQTDINTLADIEFLIHGTEWDRIWSDYVAEYNPIWNVDGTETTTETRNLTGTDTGTDTHTESGTDTKKNSGTETNADTGTDTRKNAGTETNADTGRDTVTNTGTETNADTGTDTKKNSGTETNADTGTDTKKNTGTETTDNSLYAFDSTSASPAGITKRTDDLTESLEYGKTETRTDDLTESQEYGKTSTRTDDLTEATEYGKTTTRTDNLTETQEYGKTSTRTDDLTEATEYGHKDTREADLTHKDTGTVTTVHDRHGNIGVTMTQQMLQADLDFWAQAAARFYERIIKEIVDDITYKIYTETDESNTVSSGVTITPVLTSGTVIATVTTNTDGNVSNIKQSQKTGTIIATVTTEE